MPLVRYLTHPQVQIDPAVSVPQWGLSDIGRARTKALADSGRLQATSLIICSAEKKAIETAKIIATSLGLALHVREAMHENDRTATGFLVPPEFEAVADQFFAQPTDSIRGWERAVDAQARIVREVEAVLAAPVQGPDRGDVLFVGHGAVGTLLYCHLAGVAIDRRHDQPAGGGNYFTFERDCRRVVHGWRAMETADF